VRVTDLLGLPVAALWQQKSRTALTTLGVVFGAFVLAASLSINQGVQQTIDRESRRGDVLRRVTVYSGGGGSAVPDKEVQVKGKMSEAKRQRIRQALEAQRGGGKSEALLTPDVLGKLAAMEHVESVVPSTSQYGFAMFGDQTEGASITSARPDDESCRRRLVAGRFFNDPAERAAVVGELLLYQWGVIDDDEVERALGKTMRVEVRHFGQAPGLNLYLIKPSRTPATREEKAALAKISAQLPTLLDQLDLSPIELELLRQAVGKEPKASEEVYAEELPIVGVLREPNEQEQQERRWWESLGGSDILLPYQTAAEFFFRVPAQREVGVNSVTMFVDREENVKQVHQQATELGLHAQAAFEFIERERLMWLLVFGGMTCVAAVALAVAALGIANTMLMSVLERTREIGIMKAVGASGGQLQFIFLVEGALIGLVGGAVGLLLAWCASLPGDAWVRSMVQRDMNVKLQESIFVFPPWLSAAVMLFAVLVTTLAAVYPARRAAKVDPVAALRHE
jgi:putative ABC transport system permease protein